MRDVRARLRRASWAALAGAALAAPAWADPPVHIEMWNGVRRVDVPPTAPDGEVKPAAAPAEGPPLTPPAVLPAMALFPENPAPAALPIPTQAPPGAITLTNHGALELPRLESTPPAEKETKRLETAPPRDAATPARPAVAADVVDVGLLGEMRLPLLCLAVAIFLTPFFCACVLLVLLRRLSGGGPLLRIEYVNHQPPAAYHGVVLGTLPAGVAPAAPAPAAPVPVPDVPLAPEDGAAGEPFDLGPSYEEELRQRQQQGQQQEQAVLRQLFEDNLKLRHDVRQLQTAQA